MANSATLLHSINMRGRTVHCYAVVLDTTSSDLTIRTPDSDKRLFVHGLVFSEGGAAQNLTFKTGSTTMVTPELAANQGVFCGVQRDTFYMSTGLGEALKLNTSAAISTMLIYVSESDAF